MLLQKSQTRLSDYTTAKFYFLFIIHAGMVTAYIFINKGLVGDFLGIPVVKTLPSNAGGVGLIPDLGAKISHPLQKNKQYCSKFN